MLPTRSIYEFQNAKIHLTLTFMTPMLPGDLNALSRPITYLTWKVRSVDGAPHNVSVLVGASSLLAVNRPEEKAEWAREKMGSLTALRVGTQSQPYLTNPGDDTHQLGPSLSGFSNGEQHLRHRNERFAFGWFCKTGNARRR